MKIDYSHILSDEHTIIGAILARYPLLTEAEQQMLEEWKVLDDNEAVFESFINNENRIKALEDFDAIVQGEATSKQRLLSIIDTTETNPSSDRSSYRPYLVAASVVLIVALGAYFWSTHPANRHQKPIVHNNTVHDAAPGKDGAVLTLSNGQTIVLDTATNGVLALEGKSQVRKVDGQLVYDGSAAPPRTSSTGIAYNILTTPRGRQFKLVLPDGTSVWLNSASSVKFPTQLNGHERRVELSGEAYLEVAKDPSKPFIVSTEDITIRVLGTKFNLNAYKDDGSVKATLIEGKIRIVSGSSAAMLVPGQQGKVKDYKVDVIKNVDIDETIAWKLGFISLNNIDIKEVMNQISRWYDVNIEFKSKITTPEITGTIPKTFKLSEALKSLEINTGLRFTISGNKVIVEEPR